MRRNESPLPQGQIPPLASAAQTTARPGKTIPPQSISPQSISPQSISHVAPAPSQAPVVEPAGTSMSDPDPADGLLARLNDEGAGKASVPLISPVKTPREPDESPPERAPRLYLAPTDDIEAAPSIGPKTAARFEIETPTAVLGVDLEALGRIPRQDPQYREVSYHPSVLRDLAVLLDRTTEAGEVLEAIRKTGGAALTSADVFDRWEGRGVPEGKVSLTFRLVFQRTDRNLTDSEVVKATDRLINLLAHRFGGELR